MRAYICINAKAGASNEIKERLRDLGFDAYWTFGEFDVICRTSEFERIDELVEKYLCHIREMVKPRRLVSATESFIVFSEASKQIERKPFAFCFLNVIPEVHDTIHKELIKIEEVISAGGILGHYDAICEIVAKDIHELESIVTRIQNEVPGIINTVTLIALS